MKNASEIQLEFDSTIENLKNCTNRDGLLARALEERRRCLLWVLAPSEWEPTSKAENGAGE